MKKVLVGAVLSGVLALGFLSGCSSPIESLKERAKEGTKLEKKIALNDFETEEERKEARKRYEEILGEILKIKAEEEK